MKVKVMAVVIASVLAGNVFAAAPDAERSAFEQRYVLIDSGVATIDNVRAAILSSYVKNNGWPSINSLMTDKYLATTAASWGSNTAGMVNAGGNSYTLSLPAPSADIAQGIASKVGGVAAGSSVQVTIPIPAAAAINASNLSRVAVPSNPDANKMFTNINMNNNALQNVSQIDAVVLNATTAKLGSVTVETALDVIPDATFRRNVNVLGDIKTKKVDTQTLVVAGGVNIGGNTVSTGDITGKNIISNNDIVAGGQLRAQSAVINGGVVGDSANFRLGEFESLIAKNQTVSNMFIAKGASEFYQDSLFRGSVTINGALSVGGIASALDIREGGVYLRDKYSQLAASNVFTKSNTFTEAIAANGGVTVDGKTVISADGSTLYEDGVALNAKYLGKNDKAVSAGIADLATRAINSDSADYAKNADKLDNLDSAAFAQRGAANTMTGVNTFTQAIRADGGIMVGGKWIASADGNSLYEGGVSLNSKYLGINDKAKSSFDSDKLAGVLASNYARTDIAETFSQAVTFDKGATLNGDWLRINGQYGVFFQSYGGGWNMTDSTWIRAYGGKSIFTSGMMQADGGIIVDGKWIASADGNTLYEGGKAISERYLGINDKAKNAVNSDNLGNISANKYARNDTSNTFHGLQTFNGGMSVSGVASFTDLNFVDSKGNSKSLRSMHTDVESLKSWRNACREDVNSAACGLNFNKYGSALTQLYAAPTANGVDTLSTVNLSSSIYNFTEIVVYGSDDGVNFVSSRKFTPDEYKKIASLFSNNRKTIGFDLWERDAASWRGYFNSAGTSFTTIQENSRLHAIYGVK